MKKYNKGEFGYIIYKKKATTIITIVMFAISIALYLAGYITTKTNANLLTIVAVLGFLPASKSVVGMIMFYKAKGATQEDKICIQKAIGNLDGYYDLYFTGYQKNFPTNHITVTQNSILAYSTDKKITEKDFCEHIKDVLNKERIHDVTVKLYTDRDKYCNRLQELNCLSSNTTARKDIASVLFQVSL